MIEIGKKVEITRDIKVQDINLNGARGIVLWEMDNDNYAVRLEHPVCLHIQTTINENIIKYWRKGDIMKIPEYSLKIL